MIWADRNLEHKFIEEIMVNLVKELTVPKWVLIVGPKIPQMFRIYLSNLSAQTQKFWISMKKGFIGRP